MPNSSPLKRSFPVVVWTILILLSSFIPGTEMPDIEAPDKIVHAVLYFVYTFLVARYLVKRKFDCSLSRAFVIAFIYTFVFGVIIEVVQSEFIAMRNGDLMDVVANTVGSILALPLHMIIHRKS